MKTLLLIAVLIMGPIAAAAQTNRAPWLEKDRVWGSIGANHKPIAAIQHFGCWFVLCKPIHTYLVDNVTVYYDPAIELTPTNSLRVIDVSALIRKGTESKIISIEKFGNKEYKWRKLEPKALEAAVAELEKANRWRR